MKSSTSPPGVESAVMLSIDLRSKQKFNNSMELNAGVEEGGRGEVGRLAATNRLLVLSFRIGRFAGIGEM